MYSILQVVSVLWVIPVIFLQLISVVGSFIPAKMRKTNKEPYVSFVIATWKEGERTEKCINSILAQDYPRKKIKIIVIGGGDKKTVDVCSKLSREGKITYIKENERRGKWFAVNTALKKADGDYIAFTDADCTLETGWLKKMVSTDSDIVIADVYSTSEKSVYGKIYSYIWHLNSRISGNLNKLLQTGEFMGQGSLVKKAVFKKVTFKKSFLEDWRFNYDAKSAGFSSSHSDAKTYEHMPSSVNDFRKALMRTMKGYISEIGAMRDPLSIAILFFSLIIAISTPAYLYRLAIADYSAINVLAPVLISTMIFSFLFAIRDKNYRFIFYALFVVPIVVFVCVIVIETIARMALHKEIKWEIYNKRER